jgi:plastocyanin
MPNFIDRTSFLVLLASVAAVPARAASETDPPNVARVVMKDLAFVPKVVRIKAGTTVVWTNQDDVVHTVTSGTTADDGVWVSSPGIAGGKSFSHTFAVPGTFPYFCKPHFYNEAMHGVVIVEP